MRCTCRNNCNLVNIGANINVRQGKSQEIKRKESMSTYLLSMMYVVYIAEVGKVILFFCR